MDKINPVAVVGPAYCIAWVGAGPIAPIIQEHGIQIGESLYSQHAIDTLQYRLDTANLYGLQCDKDISDLLTRAERAEAEAEALRKDAERYRWLRAIDDDAPPGSDGYPVLTQWKHVVSDRQRGTLLFGADLDAAIDAAKQAAE